MHTHRKKSSTTGPFFGPAPGAKNPAPMAHGAIAETARCSCGAIRITNLNGPYMERGAWFAPDL